MRDDAAWPVSRVRDALGTARGASLSRLIARFRDDDRAGVRLAVASAERRIIAERAEERRVKGLYLMHVELAESGFTAVAGVDEVGRGALAGPLSAGACILPLEPRIPGLDDSKKLTPQQRERVADAVRTTAVAWAVAHIDAPDIDSLGVTPALRSVMTSAIQALGREVDHVVLDGLPLGLVAHESAVVGGDGRVAAVAAASVLAKVERDRLMCEYDGAYPHYRFAENKGYGTADHLEAIRTHGRCPLHRVSFCPGQGMDPLF